MPDENTPSTTKDNEHSLVRLQISPFSLSVIDTLLGPTLAAAASHISCHQILTFPERNYGFVSLPSALAQTLQRKLNGASFRGAKMRVEEARPSKRRKQQTDNAELNQSSPESAPNTRDKRKKLQSGLLPAVLLTEGRYVKRGWSKSSEMASGGSARTSKNAQNRGELAFRTFIPSDSLQRREGHKTEVRGGIGKVTGKYVQLKEFDKTVNFPAFLRDKAAGGVASDVYEDGKGWLDKAGNVLDKAPRSRRWGHPVVYDAELAGHRSTAAYTGPGLDKSDSHSASSASSVLSSSYASSAEADNHSPNGDAGSEASAILCSPTCRKLITSPTNELSDGKSTSQIETPERAKNIHPLEALFKKPIVPVDSKDMSHYRTRPAPINISFNFGLEDDQEEDSVPGNDAASQHMPQTPFTRLDMYERGLRSAAPTPDTAAIGRRFTWRSSSPKRIEGWHDESSGDSQSEPGTESREGHGISSDNSHDIPTEPVIVDAHPDGQDDLERHFYEHRGEYSRASKMRKRDARKEARQAINRKLGIRR